MQPVILCGGYGTRLWPLSRRAWPKQFADLGFEHSLFEQTLLRLQNHPRLIDKPLIIANEQHRFLVLQQLENTGITPADIILEPESRNTAAAIALASLWQGENGQTNTPMLVLPSDHLIDKIDRFHQAISQAQEVASDDMLAIFGIVPDYAETGYGYIETGEQLDGAAFAVADFKEKPDQATAEQYLQSGRYYWNSGMFAFTGATYIEELEACKPELLASCREAWNNRRSRWEFIHPQAQAFGRAEAISIDYAVMEHTDKAAMIMLDAGWSDLGSWTTVLSRQGNTASGNQLIVSVDSENCHVQSDGKRVIGLAGVHNLLVIDTDDALLIADSQSSQSVGELTQQLETRKPEVIEQHAMTYRAWGWHKLLARTETCQINRMHIKAGLGLSFRRHQYHFEHWTVVSGSATIRYQDKSKTIEQNQSHFVPAGVAYSLINRTDQPLEIISVQTGQTDNFDNDLIRLEDDSDNS